MIDYKVFWETLKKKDLTTYNLIKDYEFSKGLIYNLKHNMSITTRTINDICDKLDIEPNELLTYTKDVTNTN